MIQSIFILSPTGEVLIERHFRGVTSRSVCDYFWEKASISLNHHGGHSTTTTTTSSSGGIISGIGTGIMMSGGVSSGSAGGTGSAGGGGAGGGISSFSDPLPLYDSVPPIMEITIDALGNSTSGGGGDGSSSSTTSSTKGTNTSGNKVVYLFSILRDGLSYLAITHGEISPLLIIEFLHRIADIFIEYFGWPADESAIKDNFSTVYQLLEEMMDHGWPLMTEPNALQSMIRPPSVMAKVCLKKK